MRPGTTGITVAGQIDDFSDVGHQYIVAAEQAGIVIAELGLARAGLYRDLTVKYYADFHVNIDDYDDMEFENLEVCREKVLEVKGILEHAGTIVVPFCTTSNSYAGTEMHVTSFQDLLEWNEYYEVSVLASTYASMEECESHLASIDTNSDDIFGGVCAGKINRFQIHLFHRP